MKFTNENKVNGELAVRGFSDKAKKYYDETEPLYVYEYEDDNGNTLYAFDFGGEITSGLSFDEINRIFEEYYDTENTIF